MIIRFKQWVENIQPGETSGKPAMFNPNAQPVTKLLTVNEILKSIHGIPYWNNIIEDYDNKDYSWPVFTQVLKYANFMKENPNSINNMPPIIVIDGKLQDGAHRISAINLLKDRIDSENSFWSTSKLKVNFYKKSDLIPGDYKI